ncbi:MAG: hypothetical protein Q7R78_00260 [bacterium]|nr:hypothetical protein [bacterium]
MESNPKEQNKIEDLKKSLYSRDTPNIMRDKRGFFHKEEFDVENNWSQTEKSKLDVHPEEDFGHQKKSVSFFKLFFATSVLFFLIAGGYALYSFLNGGNTVSAQNVDILIAGPVSVAGGEQASFNVQVFNKNSIKLEVVDLKIEFPTGTAEADNTAVELRRYDKILGDIEPGSVAQDNIRAIFFGEENSKKLVKVKIEYRIPGSNAIIPKEKTYEFFIQSSPVNILVSGNKEVISGQDVSFEARIISNSNQVLKNVLLNVVYPFGFKFTSGSTAPTFGNNIWSLGDLPPKSTKVIKINGKITGQDDESRVFRFTIGSKSVGDEKIIGTPFISISQDVQIKKPFLSARLVIGNTDSSGDYTAKPGETIKADLYFKNNLTVPISSAEIKLKFGGNAFIKENVDTSDGLYRMSEKTITWNRSTANFLDSIAPGEEGKVSFNFEPMDIGIGSSELTKNPEVTLDLSLKGNRVLENDVPEQITSTLQKIVKVLPRMSISGKIVRSSPPFDNTGPIPPKVDTKTTYTVIWTLTTTSSSIGNAVVETILPAYMDWGEETTAVDEDMIYNPVEKKITWNVGKLPAYTGVGSFKKQVAFKVILIPTLSQAGNIVTLINNAVLVGRDDFTGTNLEASHSELNTRFSSDPSFRNGDENVAR